MARQATVEQARVLRRRATATERFLWKTLRDRRLAGLKFRRQVPMGQYVLDFVCFEHKLVLEADGPFHDAARDELRDLRLKVRGFRILRLTNARAASADEVCAAILGALRLSAPSSDPASRGHLLPRGEKGAISDFD